MYQVHKKLETAPVFEQGIRGQGIGIAIVDTGIAPHPDFLTPGNRLIAFYDSAHPDLTLSPYDDSGHGTHVAGIAGSSQLGIAPECNLIGVRILNQNGNGHTDDMLPALSWILKNRDRYGIRIVNISIGCSGPSCHRAGEDSPLVRAVDSLWNAGLIVVAAAGNDGPEPMSITVPGNSRKVITVSSCEEDLQGKFPGRGPTTSCISKPDIVAPGRRIVSCDAVPHYRHSTDVYGYCEKTGTSMSTPMVSGAIALLLSRYPNLSNREIKIRLRNSAVDLGLPRDRQGWGMLNVKKLVLR